MSSLPPPLIVYPQSMKAQRAPPSSQGSFTPVYLVLGIIGALTLAACIAGRAVARRCLRPRRDKRNVVEGEIKMAVPTVNYLEATAAAASGVGGINLKGMLQEPAAVGTGGNRVNHGGAFPDHAPGPGYGV